MSSPRRLRQSKCRTPLILSLIIWKRPVVNFTAPPVYSGERPNCPLKRDWVDPRACMNVV